jgi:hypothetical protein
MDSGVEASPESIVAAGASFVGLSKDAAHLASVVAGLKAAGLRVLAWTVDQQMDYDAVMAAGCDGIFSNEPLYAARDYAYRRARAPWPTEGTFSHGMLAYPGVGPLVADPALPGGRGGFIGAPGAWRWTLDRTPYLAGPVCPVPAAGGSYTVTVQLVFDAPPAADRAGWGGLYFAVTTDDCPHDTDTSTGYLAALRWDGTLDVFGQPAARTGMVRLGSAAGSPIVVPVLAEARAAGSRVTSLPVRDLPGRLESGHHLVLPTGQAARLSAAAAAGATTLPVEPVTLSAAVAAGTLLPQQVTITIRKTPAGFTAVRTDDGGEVSCADSTWSGGYLFLRNRGDGGAAISCSSLTVE